MKTETKLAETVAKIEAELSRLGWLCTGETPCYFVVEAADDLPRGWVRLYDDCCSIFGSAEEILIDLREIGEGAEYGEGLGYSEADPRQSWREWPEDLWEQAEGPNDSDGAAICLHRRETNAGPQYLCGVEGPYQSAWGRDAVWRATAEEAIEACDLTYQDSEGDWHEPAEEDWPETPTAWRSA